MDRGTLAQLGHLLRPFATRLANTVARAVVQLVDDSTKLQLLQLGVLAEETVDGAEHHQPYGFASVPLEGAEAVVLFPNGDRSHPLVVSVSDRRHRPTGGQPGQVMVWHPDGAKVTLLAGGNIEVQPGPGGEVLIREEGGDVEPLVKRSEFLAHGHATAATGPVSPPMVAPAPAPPSADFLGTTRLRAQ